MKNWNSQRYKKEAIGNKVPDNIIRNVIAVGNKVTENRSCLPIYTFAHLCKQSSSDPKKLDRVVMRRSISTDYSNYRSFEISKKGTSSKKREINVPCPELLNIQKFINEYILQSLNVHPAVCSYNKGAKIYDAAEIHCGCEWLVKIDIKDFFGSISEVNVYRVFRSVGYPALLAFQMARVCTITKASDDFSSLVNNSKSYSLKKYNSSIRGYLPQGAPTSPLLSNIVCKKMDKIISSIADENGFIYTRYADDICLSSVDKNIKKSTCIEIVKKINCIIKSFNFEPNEKKLRIIPPGSRKVVLGLVVNGSKPHLTKSFKNNLTKHIHFCNHPDVGPELHSKHRKFDSVIGFRNHLKGLLAYSKQIDKNFSNKMYSQFEKIIWPIW